MKNWKWQQWTLFSCVLVVLVTEVVLCFTSPWSALFAGVVGVFCALGGYALKAKNVINIKNNTNE